MDDCSDDISRTTLRDICEKDSHPHLKLVEMDSNGGGGRARNVGLSYAKGKFVLFADADDFFNYCINDILEEYKDTNADIVYFKGNCVDNETYLSGKRLDYNNIKVDMFIESDSKGEYNLRYLFQVPVCKIIRREIIVNNKISFDETPIRNDVTFSYQIGHVAQIVKADKRALYCATVREGSVSSFRSSDMILVTVEVLGRAVKFFNEMGEHDYEITLCHNLYILLRRKDYDSFKRGIVLLEDKGFNVRELEQMFAKRMAQTALSSCIWNILFAPSYRIKAYSFLYLPISLMRTLKL